MSTIDKLTDIERRVLANLSEAGEEYVSALLNSVSRCSGSASEPVGLAEALASLFQEGLVEVASSHEQDTLRRTPLPHDPSLRKLQLLPRQLKWVTEDACWKWESSDPRLVVLLTPNGRTMSKRILEQFGWSMTGPA